MPEAKPNTIAPNEFLAALVEIREHSRGKDRSVAKLRTVRQRMEKAGCDMKALDLMLSLSKLEPSEAEMRLRNALRYCRWTNMPIGAQSSLFSDDADQPAAKATEEYNEALIYDEGYKAGCAGRNASDHRHAQGTPAAAKFFDGWIAGQTFLAEQLGRDREEGETLRPEKKQGRAPKGAAAASGKPRGRGGRGRGAQASL
jgi:hypothetical protein